jgi:hypothetical protein
MVRIVRHGTPIRIRADLARSQRQLFEKETTMNLLWAVAVVFFVLWVLGFVAFHVTSGLIHILLVLAVIALVVRLVSGPSTV